MAVISIWNYIYITQCIYSVDLLQQEGRLCAQHCLNSLLQGPYFSPVELSDLAQSIDNLERVQMAECGTESQSYRDFIEVNMKTGIQIYISSCV